MVFGLPTGELELKLKDKSGEHWESVSFTDGLTIRELASDVEMWSVNHKVLAARYNGKPVKIPINYHWELCGDGKVFGTYKTRKEAYSAWQERRAKRRIDKTTVIGNIEFITE